MQRAWGVFSAGIWRDNIVFVQLLALCPALAVTNSAVNGLGLGLATTAVLFGASVTVASVRGLITPAIRIPAFVLLIAALVTAVDLAMNAWMHRLHEVLGLFIPLIVTNCAILGRVELFASRQPIGLAALDALGMGLGFTLALIVLGGVRELVGSGTLFADASSLLGPAFASIELQVLAEYPGFLLAVLPPGGFLALGFLLAGKAALARAAARRTTTMLRPVAQ